MFRRAFILSVGLVGLLAMPASAAQPMRHTSTSATASTRAAVSAYTAEITKFACTQTGGANGHGKIAVKAHFVENGTTGTNYFRSKAHLQENEGGQWVDLNIKGKRTSNVFPEDGTSYEWGIKWSVSFTEAEHLGEFRQKLTYEYWDKKPGADQRLYKTKRFSDVCQA